MATKDTFRLVTQKQDGALLITDFPSERPLLDRYEQIGIDDCSTDLSLRGMPVFRGLIGPFPDGKAVVRYEAPDVYERLTKDWAQSKPKRRVRKPTDSVAT